LGNKNRLNFNGAVILTVNFQVINVYGRGGRNPKTPKNQPQGQQKAQTQNGFFHETPFIPKQLRNFDMGERRQNLL